MHTVIWVFCIALLTTIGIARAEKITVPVDDKAALEFYKNSQLVVSKAIINPFELAGCLVLHKDGQVDQYLNVLPERIKNTLKPQNITESVYRTMLTKDQAIQVGFLAILGISVSEKTLLEIAINHRWKLEAPSFWGDNELKTIVLDVGKIYANQGYTISYNQYVQYSTLVSSEYQESTDDMKSVFSYVDGKGNRYVQSSNYSQRELISIATLDIMPVLNAWNSTTISSSNYKINQSQINNFTNKQMMYDTKYINLKSVDTSDFKDKLLK